MLNRYLPPRYRLALAIWGILCILSGLTSPSLAGQSQSADQKVTSLRFIQSAGLLRVGISVNAPPFAFKQAESLVGVEPALAKEFGNFLGRRVQFVELEWKDQIPALLANRTDIIMSGMTITSMRKIRIAFSQPYFRTGQMALIHKKVEGKFPQSYYGILAQAALMTIGAIKGTTGELFVKQDFSSARKIIAYDTSSLAVAALLKGKISLFIHDAPIILWLASENEANGLVPLPSLLTEEYLAWGIRKDNEELRHAANLFIDQIRQQKRLHDILYHWIPFLK